jgi:predicted SnoaL-like aldol condensation-catalyzing enzyme
MYKYLFSLLLIFSISVLVYSQNREEASKYQSIYKGIVGALDKGEGDKLDAYIASDALDHDMDPSMTKKSGLEGIKEMFKYYHKIFPDMKTTIHSMATSGDLLFAYTTMTGTASEPYMGMPANHKISMDGVDIIRFKGDKAVEHWGFTANTDIMKMMPQNEMMNEGMDKK